MSDEQELSSADALNAAWDAAELENDDGPENIEVPESAAEESEIAGGETGEHDPEVQPAADPDGSGRSEEPEPKAAASDQPSLDKPPKGLSVEAREAWKDTPKPIQAMIAKREADFERGIMQYSENAKRAEAMDQALAPYSQYLQVNGGPQQAIGTLLQTGAMLQMGNPAQKAQLVANMIKEFQVDVKTLDGLLVGEQDPQVQRQSELDALLNQRLQPLQQQLQTYQQRDQQIQQQQQQKVMSEVEQFGAQNEFYDDVKMEMADLLDMAANRGRPMTMDEAYKIACSTHPQVNKVMQARTSQQASQTRRAAASSVRGGPGSDGGSGSAGSRLDQLNAAWDNAGRM